MSRKVTPTYTLLNQITLAANSSEVILSAIPQNYSDLVLTYSGSTQSLSGVVLNFNGDNSGSNITHVRMYGSSSGAASDTIAGHPGIDFAYSTSRSLTISQIMDYSASDKHKTVLNRWASSSQDLVMASAARWANTAPITSLRIFSSGGIVAGSTISLYGVVA